MGQQYFEHRVNRGTHRCRDGSVWQVTSPELAFLVAVTDAQWEHGTDGYTGTIAEKMSFVLVDASGRGKAKRYIAVAPRGRDLDGEAISVGDDVTALYEDKVSPAFCIANAWGWIFSGQAMY